MTRTSPLRVMIIATLAAALLPMSRSETVSRLERAGLGQTAGPPERVHLQTNRRPPKPLPVENYGIPVTYYSVRGDLQSMLTLNNNGPAPMAARVTLYARDGRRHGTDVSVPAHTFIDLDLRPIVAAAGGGFEDGSLRVSYSARIRWVACCG